MDACAATYVLIRHAATNFTGTTLLGRKSEAGLSAQGEIEARTLASKLSGQPITRLYSSPVRRAVQTASVLAEALQTAVELNDAFTELHYGDWTGRTFRELKDDPVWNRFNRFRSGTAVPNGEHILDVQRRAVNQLECWRDGHAGQILAIVSHADVIRAVLTHYLGAPLDFMLRLEVSPASISVVTLHDWGPVVSKINACEM